MLTVVEDEQHLRHRNKRSWNSPHHDWDERGFEDAAFVIQQNLTAQTVGDLTDEWSRRVAAYELLVGTPSPLVDATPSSAS